ncbi:homoserine kinase [Quercus suber]|uniref:Homoserine kinase n=1 Tax=Quercus suber TaxID=58331 RepID=A0AAW0LIL4_QUESU|nr:homoserine kinase [Quercus suber]
MALWYQPPSTLNLISPTLKLNSLRCNCNFSVSNSRPTHIPEPEPKPVFTSVKTFAPATVANLGPGFDFLGCAVDGLGDFISLSVDSSVRPGEIAIMPIFGDTAEKLSRDPLSNCAGIAAIEVMNMLGIRSVRLSLSLEKGLPLGNELGSSAAAGAIAINELFGGKLRKRS